MAVQEGTPTSGIQRAPAMDAEQFALWRTLLEQRTGMTLTPERQPFLEASLYGRMRSLGVGDYAQYHTRLVTAPAPVQAMEWAVLVDRLTVQETSFFRHPPSFALVQRSVQQWLEAAPARRTLDLWSVGCSTGEEPYSLAMLVDDALRASNSRCLYSITATDISAPALAQARAGRYAERRVERVPGSYRSRYLTPLDESHWQVKPALQERVCFARQNVIELAHSPLGNMDLIFCQNMLIYFRRWRKRDIVSRLAERLAPGGLLVLGPGEMTDWHHPLLQRLPSAGTLAYRRTTA
ncbi:CheR family methyltransferase [Isoalcanivorax beigongshangi]|uniref:protein-glutamate O-methyltransferase n=1 Tax=Isoalcanivorax beigongshangi TaxID=3238810 RepID=A0ABV4AE71_9GAMM